VQVLSEQDGRWEPGETEGRRVWFDLNRGDEAALRDLGARFSLHPLAIEDCLSPYLHSPKLEDFGNHLFFVLAGMVEGPRGPELEELDAFLGHDWLITYHDRTEPPPAVTTLSDAMLRGVALRPGVDGLFHEVADRTVDAMLPLVMGLAGELDELEERIFNNVDVREQHRTVLAKRALAGNLRRLLGPEQQFMLRLGRGEFSVVHPENHAYFRDISDHLLRIDLALEEVREDTEVALSMYLSSLNNRLSEVMKVIAVVSVLALPGTLITGIFGTNFDNVPGLHSNWGFAIMMAGIVGSAAGMGVFFRRRGWI